MGLRGLITAMVTPFAGKEVNLDAWKDQILLQIEAGVDGLLLLGSTGEAPTVTFEERAQLIELGAALTARRLPLLVGISENSTDYAVQLAQQAQRQGATQLLVCMPAYNKPSQEGLIHHVEAIASSCSLPIVLYNNPNRTVVNLLPASVHRLAQNRQIVGIKEASPFMEQASAILSLCPDSFALFAADDALTLPLMALGAKGLFSVASNLIPKEMAQLVKACAEGHFEEARKLHYRLSPLFSALSRETNPVPIKASMALRGYKVGSCRAPLTSAQEDTVAALEQALRHVEDLSPPTTA